MKSRLHLLGCVLAAHLILIAPISVAVEDLIEINYDNARTDRWRCRLCPFDMLYEREGRWSVGTVIVKDAESRFGRDNGLDDDGSVPDLDVEYQQFSEKGRRTTVRGANLGLDSRDLALGYQNSRGGISVRWHEIPRKIARDGLTPYMGNDRLTLPLNWVEDFSTVGMSRLVDSSSPFEVATHRERIHAKVQLKPIASWRFESNMARETKRGTEETFGDFLYQSVGLPKPIDYETEQLGGKVVFEEGGWLIAGGVQNSRFTNAYDSLTWENVYGMFPPSGRKALAPSNDAQTFTLTTRLTQAHTTFNGAASWSRMRQDDVFLPYTTNTTWELEPLSRDSLEGQVRTSSLKLSLITQPLDQLRFSFKHSSRDRKNESAAMLLTPVLGDLFPVGSELSDSYAYEHDRTAVELTYSLRRWVKAAIGMEDSQLRRAPAEITQNDERRQWFELRARSLRGFRFTLRLEDSDRDTSAFYESTSNNPLTRRFHQARRTQRIWSTRMDYQIPATALSIGIGADHRQSDFPESDLGLQLDEHEGWTADVSYTPNRHFALSTFRTTSEASSRTAGSLLFDSADWWYTTGDKAKTSGLTVHLPELIRGRLAISATYASAEGVGSYETQFTDSDSVFPDLISDHRSVNFSVRYRLSDRATLVGRYYRESYRGLDWARDGIGLAAARNVIAFGRSSPDYTNSLSSINLETRF